MSWYWVALISGLSGALYFCVAGVTGAVVQHAWPRVRDADSKAFGVAWPVMWVVLLVHFVFEATRGRMDRPGKPDLPKAQVRK